MNDESLPEYPLNNAQLLVMKQIPVGVHSPQGFIRIEANDVETYHAKGHVVIVLLTSNRAYQVNQRQPGRGRYFALDKK